MSARARVSPNPDSRGRPSAREFAHRRSMNLQQAIFLFFASILGGALNAFAGGGSFICFPALLFIGVPPIPANATNTVGLWTGVTASTGAYRNRLNMQRRLLIPMVIASLAGGALGALLLLKTPAQTFMRVLPWLMLAATLLFIFGRKLAGGRRASVLQETGAATIVVLTVLELFVGAYGGYFGGGMGIVILAMLAAVGMSDIHAMNALKSVLSMATNGVAVVTFILARAVYWPQAGVMIAGALIGGYFGAHYAQRLPAVVVRWFVILVGSGMTVYFFVKAY